MYNSETEQKLVKISAASRLSGIRVETLRAWDKRKQLVATRRIGNTRYYSQNQVKQMQSLNLLIKSGAGYSIGDLCTKSNAELDELVGELHSNPQLHASLAMPSKDAALIVGWRLMKLRDTAIEDEQTRTSAPNLHDLEAFYEFLHLKDHDLMRVAVLELPATWDLPMLEGIRKRVDDLDQAECELIGVCLKANPDHFESDKRAAERYGITLLNGNDLNWQDVLAAITEIRRLHGETVQETSGRVSRDHLYRLIESDSRVNGIAVADIARLYAEVEDLAGLALRESNRQIYDSSTSAILDHLNSVLLELESCLGIVAELDSINRNF